MFSKGGIVCLAALVSREQRLLRYKGKSYRGRRDHGTDVYVWLCAVKLSWPLPILLLELTIRLDVGEICLLNGANV